MEKIKSQSHDKEALLYIFSKALERASYYGIRALIVIFMISGPLNMGRADALSIYGWFTLLIILSQIGGGIIGDLVAGNRKSIILGGAIQAIGAFTLCTSSISGLYLGLVLIIIGGGLYTPNITSNFGKLYLNKVKLLDSAFALDYLAINLGAFSGILLITYCGEEYGWNTGFMIAGTLMLISIIPIIFSNKEVSNEVSNNDFSISQRVKNILCAVLLVALFWVMYETPSFRFTTIQLELSEVSKLNLPEFMWTTFQSVVIFPILIVIILLWSYLYSSYQFKLMLGFIFGAISYGFLFYIPEYPSDQHTILYFASLTFLCLSEVHIAPILSSVVTKYSNPKYLAIIFSLVFIPSRLFAITIGFLTNELDIRPSLVLTAGIVAMIIISIGLIIYQLANKNSTYNKL